MRSNSLSSGCQRTDGDVIDTFTMCRKIGLMDS